MIFYKSVRWICALFLAEIKEINDQIIPENIQKKFKENISYSILYIPNYLASAGWEIEKI